MKKIVKRIAFVLLALILLFVAAAAVYVYNNMNYDRNDAKKLTQAGFAEKQATLPDGTVLSYGEGPENGPPLFLIHGQMTQWENYVAVLPELSKHFHIFAVDCHGHGGSSQNPAKYSANAMGADFIWFIENVIGKPAVVSGHSSGGLMTAWIAANSPENVLGIVLEDPPFFATEPGRAEKTFAWHGFEVIHNFLNQTEEGNYTQYWLEHNYMQKFFGEGWKGIKQYAYKYMDENPDKPLRIFFLPPAMNRSFDLTADSYDLHFGEAFYDFSWLDGFDQAQTLSRIDCPAVLIHTNWSYDEEGTLLAAMDGDDAKRAHELIAGSTLIAVNSGHNVHVEKPKEFIKIMLDFLETLPSQ